jgi:cobyrinic acid a,c-diamide synthase
MIVAPFKKGPDYIDTAWLGWAANNTARNLDLFMVPKPLIHDWFFHKASEADIALIEGNRGLFDGMDTQGSYSSAELAKLLKAPVVILMDATKMTRTAAVLIYGLQKFEPEITIAGVIFNKVAGERHRRVLMEAVESICGIPVLGFIPKLEVGELLPGRHLGLVTPAESDKKAELEAKLVEFADKHLFTAKIFKSAIKVEPPPEFEPPMVFGVKQSPKVRICYFYDSAFTFYYPENLEALEYAGAELIPLNSMTAKAIPPCDGLYIGGGFPETHLKALSENASLKRAVKNAALAGLPIYAECGGLIYLCQSLRWQEESFPLAGVFPLRLEMWRKPVGHGYIEVKVDRPTPFFNLGDSIRGHEFHYTRVMNEDVIFESALNVERGYGITNHRDGIIFKNVLASFTHIHALSVPQWAENFVRIAENWRKIVV